MLPFVTPLRRTLRHQVETLLESRLSRYASTVHEIDRLSQQVAVVSTRVQTVERSLDDLTEASVFRTRPFESTMTIDQAWRRHPDARVVFSRFHLPRCDKCAVRFDETIEEAAAAYGIDESALLTALNSLL